MTENAKKRGRFFFIFSVVIFCALVLILIIWDAVKPDEIEKNNVVMGTYASFNIKGKKPDEAYSKIYSEINALENKISWRIESSEISKINTLLSCETDNYIYNYIDTCIGVSKSSSGAFDISLGALSDIWGFSDNEPVLPDAKSIKNVVNKYGWEKIVCKDRRVTVPEGVKLDLGAVGKGIACDKASSVLDGANAKSAIISIGGSILLWGKETFTVGIADPSNSSAAMGTIKLSDCFISTSGSYQKNFTDESGTLYHHILDPSTGYSASSGLLSVTVICNSGLLSDALSTACFVLGYENSLELLKEYNAQAIFITQDNELICTDELKGQVNIINDIYTENAR